jgi:hypothetical protein
VLKFDSLFIIKGLKNGGKKMKKTTILIFSILILLGLSPFALATQDDLTLSGKEIIERLTRIEEGQKGLDKGINGLRGEFRGDINDLGKRVDDQGKGIDDLRSELKEDIQDLRGLMYVLLAGMFVLVGFVIWDRRTALSPVISKTKELEEREDLTLRALKEYARKEPKMAEVLRTLGVF